MTRLSRRQFMGRSTAFGLTLPALTTAAFAQDNLRLHMATVLPGRTGPEFIKASVNDVIGSAARNGALLADIDVVTRAEPPVSLDLLFASAPTPEAAIRAGERLVEAQGVKALIGGVGDGQAEVLAEIAARTGVIFMNIGGTADSLRQITAPTVFHIEASDAMYLDAMAQLAVADGQMTWAVVADSSPQGKEVSARLQIAADKVGATIAGMVETYEANPYYGNEVAALREISADVVFVLLDVYDQTAFLITCEEEGEARPFLTMPHPLTQTRDYIASARRHAAQANPRRRVALWDTTISDHGARNFNTGIRARYAEPADPTAWSAYAAVKILAQAAAATGSADPAVLAAYLVDPATSFDLSKGTPLSFRPWDRQLRQPLVRISVDQEVEWKLLDLSTHIDLAAFEGMLPADLTDGNAALDTLGDLAG